MIKVLDVSSHQATMPSLAGFDGLIVKATEGSSYASPTHGAQVAAGRTAGLVVGHYHYVNGNSSMQAQADFFLREAAPHATEFLVLDWETTDVSGADKDAFLKYLKSKAAGRKCLLYCSVSFWKERDTTSYAADGLWIAEYGVPAGKPAIQAPWLLHQYTDSPVDTSVGDFASRAAMAEWAGTPKPKPKPVVDLSNLMAAAKADPKAKQGHASHPADVKPVEAALKAEKLLAASYATDGSFGSLTVAAYAAWQRKCGYSGADANGIPGNASLKALGARHGFTVKA